MREVIIFYAGALAKTGHRSIETTTERPGSRLYGREDTPISLPSLGRSREWFCTLLKNGLNPVPEPPSHFGDTLTLIPSNLARTRNHGSKSVKGVWLAQRKTKNSLSVHTAKPKSAKALDCKEIGLQAPTRVAPRRRNKRP